MAEKSYSDQLKDIEVKGFVTSSETNNVSIMIIDSGSNTYDPLSISLVRPTYDTNEIVKAIDIEISELLPFVESEQQDVVPRSLYNDRLSDIAILQEEAIALENEIDQKIEVINILLQDSASLVSENTNLRQETEFFKEQYSNAINDINQLATDLGKSISEAVELKIVNVGLFAENAGLEAERNSLKTQVESLTAQLEGIQSITTAGGELSGQLSVGIIPDERFIGKSEYDPRVFPFREQPRGGSSAYINTAPKNYTIKNASTDVVTLNIQVTGDSPEILDVALRTGEKINATITKTLQSGEDVILIVDVSYEGTRKLNGGQNKAPKDYFATVLIQVTSADQQLTEDLEIDCKVIRQSR